MSAKIRKFKWDDIDNLVDMINRSQVAEGAEERVTREAVEHSLNGPFLEPEADIFLAEAPDGNLVAFGLMASTHVPYSGMAELLIHPDHREGTLGTEILRKLEDQFVSTTTPKLKESDPLYAQIGLNDTAKDRIALLEQAGYTYVRSFYTMEISLDQPIAMPELPDGFTVRVFNPETDKWRAYEAHQDSFRDHWGHIEDTPYERWEHRLTDPDFDPNLWFLAYAGDEVAGISFCNPPNDNRPNTGWVNNLGVRSAWRRRGLGEALLKHSFYEFQQRGWKRGELGVDASSKTNAVALYERAGMSVKKQQLVYRKVFRGNPDDILNA